MWRPTVRTLGTVTYTDLAQEPHDSQKQQSLFAEDFITQLHVYQMANACLSRMLSYCLRAYHGLYLRQKQFNKHVERRDLKVLAVYERTVYNNAQIRPASQT
jgi:hypothetical protein